jgi:hypothetical protein
MRFLKVIFLVSLLFTQYLCGQDLYLSFGFEPKLSGELFFPRNDYTGSRIFLDRWMSGDIILRNGLKVKNKILGYNGLEDELIWIDKQVNAVIKLDKGLIDGFELRNPDTGEKMTFRKIFVKSGLSKDTIPVFVQVLFEGERLTLYVQRKIENVYTEKYGGVVTNASRKFLEPQPVYFIFQGSSEYFMIKRIKRKDLFAAFPREKQKIKKILHTEHVPLQDEFHLIKAVELVDKIIN